MNLGIRLAAILLSCAGAVSAQDALALLTAAQQAQSARSFEGVVVFMHDGRFDAVRVVPLLDEDVHAQDGLLRLAGHVFGSEAA